MSFDGRSETETEALAALLQSSSVDLIRSQYHSSQSGWQRAEAVWKCSHRCRELNRNDRHAPTTRCRRAGSLVTCRRSGDIPHPPAAKSHSVL